eukprot:gene13061-biopygen6490
MACLFNARVIFTHHCTFPGAAYAKKTKGHGQASHARLMIHPRGTRRDGGSDSTSHPIAKEDVFGCVEIRNASDQFRTEPYSFLEEGSSCFFLPRESIRSGREFRGVDLNSPQIYLIPSRPGNTCPAPRRRFVHRG